MNPIKIISFDCYGTLIDWEKGILDALQPWLKARGHDLQDEALLATYARLEPAAEAGTYKRYREVLHTVMRSLASELGIPLEEGEEKLLAGSLGRWPAFPDSVAAMKALGANHRLAILSNVDNDLIAETLTSQGLAVDIVFTAEDARAYKPSALFFSNALRRLAAEPSEILHCGCSKYHDLAPAKEMGFSTAWINRRIGKAGSGATPQFSMEPDFTFGSLEELADWAARLH